MTHIKGKKVSKTNQREEINTYLKETETVNVDPQ